MPGFIANIATGLQLSLQSDTSEALQVDYMSANNFQLARCTIKKFLDDKIFYENDFYIIVIEGVVLNKKELITRYRSKNWIECVLAMYRKEGETFFDTFRGSFSGIFYDKTQDKWLIFTDHIGSKQVFFQKNNEGYIIASELKYIYDFNKANSSTLSLNVQAAYMALTMGYVIEDNTLLKDVKKLMAGHYLCIKNNVMEKYQYHRFSNKPNNEINKQTAIEGIDKYFKQAIKRAFDKDLEYGYNHIVTLSGGLDSRMTAWVAHQLGYTKQLNITFSQSNYLDFQVAQNIARDLRHEFLFKFLDNGTCIYELDNITPITMGSACFFGLSHGRSLYDKIDFKNYGLLHTGQIGDAIIGTFFSENRYNSDYNLGMWAYSDKLLYRLKDYQFIGDYENEEIYCLYGRAFSGTNQGLLPIQEKTETYSPFYDVDFLEFCYSIPLTLRFNHKIYIDWILCKYPDAAEYIWEKAKCKIYEIKDKKSREIKYYKIFGKKIVSPADPMFLNWFKRKFQAKFLKFQSQQKSNKEENAISYKMNPFDFWYSTNEDLKNFMDSYWMKNKAYISDVQLLSDMTFLYEESPDVIDKLQCLSVLSLIKFLNSDIVNEAN